MAVVWVALSAPNSGTVVEAAQSRDGSIDTKCTARVSPGSAPSTWNGPVWGFTKRKSITRETTSSGPRTLPPKASSVQTSSTVPGRTLATGLTPPKVQANCDGSGRKLETSRFVTLAPYLPGVVGAAVKYPDRRQGRAMPRQRGTAPALSSEGRLARRGRLCRLLQEDPAGRADAVRMPLVQEHQVND